MDCNSVCSEQRGTKGAGLRTLTGHQRRGSGVSEKVLIRAPKSWAQAQLCLGTCSRELSTFAVRRGFPELALRIREAMDLKVCVHGLRSLRGAAPTEGGCASVLAHRHPSAQLGGCTMIVP